MMEDMSERDFSFSSSSSLTIRFSLPRSRRAALLLEIGSFCVLGVSSESD